MRKTLIPGSNDKDRRVLQYPIKKTGWASGIINDPPASSIPENALAYGENVIVYPTEIISRTGSRLWTSREIPPLKGRTGYTASKTGTTITTTTPCFTADDVGNYFVWPGSIEREHDEIIAYTSSTQVTVADSGTKSSTPGCYVRGKGNLWCWHSVLSKFLLMYGKELWVTDVEMSTWEEVLIISRDKPNNSVSDWDEFDDNTYKVFNSNGIFIVDLYGANPIAYKNNIPIPNIKIPEVEQTPASQYEYGYLYGAARLTEQGGIIDRLSPSRIEMETGTNIFDEAGKDNSDIWTDDPIGPTDKTYQKLICAYLNPGYDNAGNWAGVTNGTFRITINGIGPYDIFCNFTGVVTMAQVAAVIQTSLRDYYPDATCIISVNRFVLSSGRIDGGTISYASATGTGTDISAPMSARVTNGATISTLYVYTPKVIGPLYVPVVPNTTPQEYQWHLTHFPIYRTLDKQGLYKQGTSEQRLNDPETYIWVKDLRICAAFFARKFNKHALARIGTFEEADVGSIIEWEDGSRNTIISFVASHDVVISDSSQYYGIETGYMAAAIGNGRVIRASQTGTTVTRTNGDTFTSADIGKTLNWATGYASIITSYVDSNTVTVNDDYDKDSQGVTLDPISRYFNDTISDDTLRTRMTTYLCASRWLQAMENCNVGLVVPGFMITAKRGGSHIEYCQLPTGYEYLSGFCNKGYQFSDVIKDNIIALMLFPNKFVALCEGSVWHSPTNVSDMITITGAAVSVLTGIDILDGSIGCFDWGSVQQIEYGIYRMLTSEPGGIGMRDFNGSTFGDNQLVNPKTGQTNWFDSFEKLQKATASIFDGLAGYIIWGKDKP